MWEIDIFLFVLYLKNTCDKILMNTRDPRCSGKGRNTVGRVAIVGFGSAGYHAARALSIRCPGEEIHVYSTTDDGPSNPMLTTYYASGRIAREALFPFGSREQVVRELGIRLFANTPVVRLRADERALILENGTARQYDDIVIATGARALIPPIPGLPEQGVYAMRTVDDAEKLYFALEKGLISSALVVGASMVGIKVVEALRNRGIPVALADLADRIFPLAALPEVSEEIHGRLRSRGVQLLFGRALSSLERTKTGITAHFADGSAYTGGAVFFCMGTRPCLELVDREELEVGRALKVDDHMRTSRPHIYAAGDCCETRELVTGNSMSVGLWANAAMQGETAGANIAGNDSRYQGNLIHNITHYWDTDFIGLGDNRAEGERMTYIHPREGWRFDAVVRDGRPVCINILDNHTLSGPAKALLIKRLTAPEEPMGPVARLTLQRSGLPGRIIAAVGGFEHDGTGA